MKKQGFTLVELLIAVGILSILLGIAAPAWQKMIDGIKLKSAARQMNSLFVYAREQAILSGRIHLVLCQAKNWLALELAPEKQDEFSELKKKHEKQRSHDCLLKQKLPDNVAYQRIKINDTKGRDISKLRTVHFFDDGSVTPAQIIIANMDSKPSLLIAVDISGKIVIEVQN
jgi:prepilin-type N-terminal cleavage/methylation domain-containing protein